MTRTIAQYSLVAKGNREYGSVVHGFWNHYNPKSSNKLSTEEIPSSFKVCASLCNNIHE